MNELLNESFIADQHDDDDPLSEPQDAPLVEPPSNVTCISEARLLANRQNAKLSSGPRTCAGKEVVSANSVRHGLSGGKFRVLSTESQADYDELLASLLASYAPADDGESELVISMAQTLWLARRAISCQDRCVEALESGDAEAARGARLDLALYLRYQTTHERAHSRYGADLRKLQSERRKAELGFASQKAREADQARKQEMHEGRLAHLTARTELQIMKNRSFSYAIAKEDRWFEEDQRRRERERKREEQRKAESCKEYEELLKKHQEKQKQQ